MLVVALQISTAAAQSETRASELLAQAQVAADGVDFQAARKLVKQAFAAGGMDPGELARAHRFAGEIDAAVGDEDAAREHFVRWLLLDPQAALAPGVSPKITAAFDGARREAAGLGRLAVSARLERTEGKATVIFEARDPADMITQFRVRAGGGREAVERDPRLEVAVADTESVAVSVAALDGDGNEVWKDDLRGGPRLLQVDGRFPVWARWPTWTAVAGLAAGGGIYFGLQVGKAEDDLRELNENSSMHTFDEAKDIEDRGRRNALYANLSFGVAGAAAIGAVLTFVLEPRGVELVPAPTAGGATIDARLRF